MLFISIGFFLGISLLFNSCDKVNDILALPSMTAKVDNTTWTSVFNTAAMYRNNDYISIIGAPEISADADKLIRIEVNQRLEGKYEFEMSIIDDCMIYYSKTAGATYGSSDYYEAILATVTITKIDTEKKTISGTFSGTLIETSHTTNDEINITEGKFDNISYQEIE